MRKRIYVAGPLSSDPLVNTAYAIKAGQELIEAGFAPYVPHLTQYWEALYYPGVNSWETWLEIDLPWVSKADAVLRLPGESPGADREVALAYGLDIPVFHDIQHLVLWFASSEAKEPENSIPAKSENQTYCGCPSGNFRADREGCGEPSYSFPTPAIYSLPKSLKNIIITIVETFASKNADYAADADGWRSNFDDIARQCGISATEAANTLIAVKQARLRALSSNGRAPANEAIEDTLLDRAVYAVIALALYQEDNK